MTFEGSVSFRVPVKYVVPNAKLVTYGMKLVEVEENRWVFEDPAITDAAWEKLDMALETWEADHPGRAEKMLLAIVAECPSHIDALHHLSIIYDEQGRGLEAYVFCQAAVSIGLQAIPEKFKWEQSLLEWSMLENRPFRRAYHNLGLWHLNGNRYDDAIEIFARLLSTNPNDNQGVRHLLPLCWFEKNDLTAILDLCRAYSGDATPEILYSEALALARLGRDEDALAALKNCVAVLPLVGKELLKKRHPRPKFRTEGYISHGGHDQAYDYWQYYGKYWSASESAMSLLRQVVNG